MTELWQNRLGDRSFDVAGPRILNKLPASVRLVEDFG